MRKEKTKSQKQNIKHSRGITLIALIITIVVLLILAVVSIGTVKNSRIISHSQNASTKWEKAQENENKMLTDYLDKIESNLPEDSKTYYFYTETYYLEGENRCVLVVLNDLGDNQKGMTYIEVEDDVWYYFEGVACEKKTYTEDTSIGVMNIDAGTSAIIFEVDPNEYFIYIEGSNEACLNSSTGEKIDKVDYKEDFKTIIENAERA